MIVFDLLCGGGHRFEGWFGSADDFASQSVPSATRATLGAPEPKPAAPATGAPAKTPDMEGKDPFAIAQMLYSRMLDDLLTKSEDVGRKFPDEARKIFYKEAPARAIRGQASNEEHQELLEEGIPVARLPVPPTDKLN
jgi:hypothetical protein